MPHVKQNVPAIDPLAGSLFPVSAAFNTTAKPGAGQWVSGAKLSGPYAAPRLFVKQLTGAFGTITSCAFRLQSASDASGTGAADVAGAIFGSNNPRIVKVDSFYLEAVPEGYILILHNRDVPGVVGAVGTLLGKKGINIGGLELGRQKGGKAISFIHVDDAIPKPTLQELRSLPNIVSAELVKL